MIDLHALLMAFAVGVPAAALFFWGLALGMRKALASSQPALWLFGSFILRSALLVAVAYGLIQWLQPLSALVGFTLSFMLLRVLSVRIGGKHGFNT